MNAGDAPRTYLRITKWETFQHYKGREIERPAWIKFYASSLDSADLIEQEIATRLLANLLLLVAARTGNRMPNDPRTLAKLVHLPPQTVRKAVTKLLEIRWIEQVNLTEYEADLASQGQMRLTDSRPAPTPESRPRARGRAVARAEAERKDLPSSGLSSKHRTPARDETTALPMNLNGQTTLDKLTTLAGCDHASTGVIAATSKGMPENFLALALESLTGRLTRQPPLENRPGYVVNALKAIAADHGWTPPAEPPDDF